MDLHVTQEVIFMTFSQVLILYMNKIPYIQPLQAFFSPLYTRPELIAANHCCYHFHDR